MVIVHGLFQDYLHIAAVLKVKDWTGFDPNINMIKFHILDIQTNNSLICPDESLAELYFPDRHLREPLQEYGPLRTNAYHLGRGNRRRIHFLHCLTFRCQ